VVASVEGRGRRIAFAEGLAGSDVAAIAAEVATHLAAGGRRGRGFRVETIDGRPALGSPHLEAMMQAGYRREANGLRFGGIAY
jgi:hypothetical protein